MFSIILFNLSNTYSDVHKDVYLSMRPSSLNNFTESWLRIKYFLNKFFHNLLKSCYPRIIIIITTICIALFSAVVQSAGHLLLPLLSWNHHNHFASFRCATRPCRAQLICILDCNIPLSAYQISLWSTKQARWSDLPRFTTRWP